MRTASAVVVLGLLLTLYRASAVQLDMETHNALIGKLAEVRANLPPGDPSVVPSTLRQADLYADRARLHDIDFIKAGHSGASPLGKADRTTALQLISSVESSVQGRDRHKIWLQKAQLHELLGQVRQSEDLLVRVFKAAPNSSAEFLSSLTALADLYFSRGDFKNAGPLYQQMQNSSAKNPVGEYRLAWCELNLRQERQAVRRLERLLDGKDIDGGLRKDATRDLVIFYARQQFSPDQIQKIVSYSEPDQAAANLKSFSNELRRLGNKAAAATVLFSYLSMTRKGDDSLLAQADLFEIFVDMGQRTQALETLEQIVKRGCGKGECVDVQFRLHRGLRAWGTAELKQVSGALVSALQTYSRMLPYDEGAILFGIKTLQDSSVHAGALPLLAVVIRNTTKKDVLENALRAQIVSAEKTKSLGDREKAYKDYLAQGADEKLKHDIEVDLVQATIDNKNWQEAEPLAEKIYARRKSPEVGRQLLLIYQGSKQTDKELGHLFVLADGESDNVKKYRMMNDAFLLATRTKSFTQMKKASERLVALAPALSVRDKNLVFEKRILVADLELDYATSLAYDSQLQVPESEARDFRLALKARLAGTPNRALEKRILGAPYYAVQKRIWALENQLAETDQPFRLLKRYATLVRGSEDFPRLVFIAMSKEVPSAARRFVAVYPELRTSLPRSLIQRRDQVAMIREAFTRAIRPRVSTQSLPGFSGSLDRIAKAHADYDRQTRSLATDAFAAMLVRAFSAELNRDLGQQLQRGKSAIKISPQMRVAFDKRIDDKVKELRAKADQMERDNSQQWRDNDTEKQFGKMIDRATTPQRQVLARELKFWVGTSPDSYRKLLSRLDGFPLRVPEVSLEGRYANLRRNPFEVGLAGELAQQEEARGNSELALFLTERERRVRDI